MICQLQNWDVPETWGHIRIMKSKEWNKGNSTTFRYTGESTGSVMSLILTDYPLHTCQSHSAWKSVEAILGSCVRIRDTRSHSRSNAAAYAWIWSTFRCTAESSSYVFSRIMTEWAQYMCQSHLAQRHSRCYSGPGSQDETPLAYLRQSDSLRWRMLHDQVHQKGLSTYPYGRSITVYLPILVAMKSV